ncbi:MAG: helix-turn-helix domain-containing protein [Acidobacteriota bacterium]|nr:helix-turn-helix domain-containing protein [Acidobacteriota bacterium]
MAIEELTTREAAARLDESDRLVRLWCQQGRFPHARRVEHPRGDYWAIPASDLKGFVKPKPGPVPKSAHTTETRAPGRIRANNSTSTGKKRGGKK